MIELKPLFDIHVDVAEPQVAPDGPYGTRRFIPITGGHFSGERLSGRLLPGGADCQLIRPDDVAELEVRLTYETDDGVIFLMKGLGMRHGSPDIIAQIARGELVDPSLYYFRESAIFEAPPGPHEWLNKIIAIGTGQRLAREVIVKFYEVL